MSDKKTFTKGELLQFMLEHLEPLQKHRKTAKDFFESLKPPEFLQPWPVFMQSVKQARADAYEFCDKVDACVAMLKALEDVPPKPTSTNYNWPEDFDSENGKYYNICTSCKLPFIGHKRRVTCKVCANLGRSDRDWVNDPTLKEYVCRECNRPFSGSLFRAICRHCDTHHRSER
jgi:hypothetical protein